MAEQNTSEIKEIKNFSDINPQEMMSEEGSVRTVIVKDVGNVKDVINVAPVTKEVPKSPSVSSRRHSTGAIGTRGGKLEVQSRYRGNHHVPSTHDRCKHGTLCERVDAVKPWKVVRRRSVEGSEVVKAETSFLRRMSLGSYAAAKRDSLASETSSVKGSVDGLSVRSNDKARKNRGTESSRFSDTASSNVSSPKTPKAKAQTRSGEDVKEKTVCVVEASVKGVEKSYEKKTITSRLKSLATPKRSSTYHSPTKQVPGNVSTSKKEIMAKKIGVKKPLAKQVSSKKGKTLLEPKLEEQETLTEESKKNLKGVDDKSKSVSCEGSKGEKVVLRRVQGKRKVMTLLNGVIEETVNKLKKVKKNNVKALIDAFETVIALHNTKTPQIKEATSESKVSPLGSKIFK